MNDSLKNMSPKQRKEMQQKLDSLCAEYGVKSWAIDASRGAWKELCLKMIGLEEGNGPKKAGRKALDDQTIYSIGLAVDVFMSFEDLSTNPPRSPTKKETFYHVAQYFKIKEKQYYSGRTSSPEEIVRGIYNRYKKEETRSKLDNEYQESYNHSEL